MTQRRILVTAALPYANGPIHLGHLVEYIQTDIWVRFQKLRGHRCIYLCADDTHGTAIMLRAQKEGRSEEEIIAETQTAHERDFAGFQIEFDNYGSTHSDENRQLCAEIWSSIRKAGLVKEKEIQQLYDVEAGTFLADRFVRGTCPNCKAENQPGDNCSKCGATYSPAELTDPVSAITQTTPELRPATHLFIELEKLHDFLDEWTQAPGRMPEEIAKYLKGQFLGSDQPSGDDGESGRKELRDWDISRPAPYFGFEIPDSPGNYWYVWFDAPIGYMASTKQWCDKHGESFDDWWRSAETEIHHFIGKDIAYFHTLFWPGMLKSAGFTLPTRVQIHGFLTVDGAKMSKSEGTFVKAETFLKYLDPSYLRYYYASKMGPRVDDLDLNLDEFASKVRSDLVGKIVNLASRTAKFAHSTGLSAEYPDDGGLFAQGAAQGDQIADAYENYDYNKAMRLILELADRANPYIEGREPWNLRKDPQRQQELQDVCTVGMNLFWQIVVYLSPVLPKLAEQTGELFGQPITNWEQSQTPLTGIAINKFKHLMERVDPEKITAMIEESKVSDEPAEDSSNPYNDSDQPLKDEPICDEITIDDFAKVDLRVARVLEAEHVEEARKLLKLKLSLGGNETRQVFAGIKEAYEPEKLVGRLVIMVANLAPRKMRFGLSEGMVAAGGPGGPDVFLLGIDEGAQPGQRVH
ncbi:MAG: methionine--tRNA ligase [Planctomycetales bacterium]|nr:methionine--tRNA ligase [Planctomycetales bacterium]